MTFLDVEFYVKDCIVDHLNGIYRNCDKEQSVSNGTSGAASCGGIAVPVVKSTPSAAVAAWIQSATAADSVGYWSNSYAATHQRTGLHDNGPAAKVGE